MKQYKFNANHYWFVWLIVTTLAYWYVQDTWRPSYRGDNPWIQYILGVAPNYLPSIGLPAGLYVILYGIRAEDGWWSHWPVEQLPLRAWCIAIGGLLAWEFAQIFLRGGTFDWHDILWTLLGGLTFWGIWWLTPIRYRIIEA